MDILRSILIVCLLDNTFVIRKPCTLLLFASLTFLGKFPLALVGKDVDTPNKNSHMNEFVRCSSLLQDCRSQGAGGRGGRRVAGSWFWLISLPLFQPGGSLCPSYYRLPFRIFRTSYGPVLQHRMSGFHIHSFTQLEPTTVTQLEFYEVPLGTLS